MISQFGTYNKRNSGGWSLNLELYSCKLSAESKITKIAMNHTFYSNLDRQYKCKNHDIIILEGDEIPPQVLDNVEGLRCFKHTKEKNIVSLLNIKNEPIDNIHSILKRINSVAPSLISLQDAEKIGLEFNAFIRTPHIRNLRKMQYEAQLLYDLPQTNTDFKILFSTISSNSLKNISSNSVEFESLNIPDLKALATKIHSLYEEKNSQKKIENFEVTDPDNFILNYSPYLISQIKRVARQRIRWGYDKNGSTYFKEVPARCKQTISYMLNGLLSKDLLEYTSKLSQEMPEIG